MINVHQSTTMTIPTIAFATSYWDGEQLGGIPRGQWSSIYCPRRLPLRVYGPPLGRARRTAVL